MPPICPVRVHVRAAASGEVEVADVDKAQLVALGRRKFAQAQRRSLVPLDEPDVDRTIVEDDFVGQTFGRFDLLFAERGRVEINGAVVVSHVEGDRGHFE